MTGKPKIVRLITRLNIGGPARQALLLTEELQEDFDTTLMTGAVSPGEAELRPGDLEVHRVPNLRREINPARDLVALLHIYRELRRVRPLILHTHMSKAGAIGRLAGLVARVPILIHTHHGHVLEGYFSKPVAQLYMRIERWLAGRTDRLIAVSPQVRDELLALQVGSPDRWDVIRLGFELKPLLELDQDPVASKQALGLPPDRPAVGIVGRLVPIKDHYTFLAAARRIAQSVDATFVIIGDGELRRRLEIESANLGNRVRFLGWVYDLPTLYSALDLVVLTSRNEGTPVSLIEAMAASTPVIATNVGGVADCVPETAGILIEPGDVDGLAVSISKLLSDRDQARRLGDEGRINARSRYGSTRLVSEIRDLYLRQIEARDG